MTQLPTHSETATAAPPANLLLSERGSALDWDDF
jgi:hypothetical protein